MQLFLITLFNANFPDMLRTTIIIQLAMAFKQLKILIIDAADITDDMRNRFLFPDIGAKHARFDFYTWKTVAVDCKSLQFLRQ